MFKQFLEKIRTSKRGEMSPMLSALIGLFLVLVIGSALLPTALDAWYGTATNGFSTTGKAIFPIVADIAIIAVLILIVKEALS